MRYKKTKNGLSLEGLKAHYGEILKQEPQKLGVPNGVLESFLYKEIQVKRNEDFVPFPLLVHTHETNHKLSEYCMEINHCKKHQKNYPLLVIRGAEGMGKKTLVEALRIHLELDEGLEIISNPKHIDTSKAQVLIANDFLPFFLKEHLYYINMPEDYYSEIEKELMAFYCERYEYGGEGDLLKYFEDKKVPIIPSTVNSIFSRASQKANLRGEVFGEFHIKEALSILPEITQLLGAEEVKKLNSFEEFVVSDEILEGIEEIILRASHKTDYKFLNREKNFGSVVALFSGPSGVGKTMACKVIAHELNKPLWMVSVPQILNRYVGDSEKALDTLFKEAEKAGVILLFDEVDSLASDRAYMEKTWERSISNTLLNLMDAHEGVIVMTTNFAEVLDKAFNRRVNHKIKFSQPSLEQRAEILKRHLLPDAPLKKGFDFLECVKGLEVNGGHIKNAVARLGTYLLKNNGKKISEKVMRDLLVQVQKEASHIQLKERKIGI